MRQVMSIEERVHPAPGQTTRSSGSHRSIVLILLVLLLACIGNAAAQTDAVSVSYLRGKAPVAVDAIDTLGADLFGDEVNMFNGAVSFEQTDFQLPGNSALPVALARSFSPRPWWGARGALGDWDLNTPRIEGTFSEQHGFVSAYGGGPAARCSSFYAPPEATAGTPGQDFATWEFWQGTSIVVPGQKRQEILVRNPAFAMKPTDGANYPLVTRDLWQVGCLPALVNGAGQGFVAVSPDGVRYRFDWVATRYQASVRKGDAVLPRRDWLLMATQVTDRFGNWVRYTYDSANPLLLTRIESSDQRLITLNYSGGRLVSASNGTGTWQYQYTSQGDLSRVTRPDGSFWSFNLRPMVYPENVFDEASSDCDSPVNPPPGDFTGTMRHPSGAEGRFKTRFQIQGRSGVQRVCTYHPGSTWTNGAVYAKSTYNQALVEKTISGPGISPLTWSYQTSNGYAGDWTPCAACPDRKVNTLVGPQGKRTTFHFGIRWRVNEGLLLRKEEGWVGSTRTTDFRYRDPAGQAYPPHFGTSVNFQTDQISYKNLPQDQRIVTQQGATFSWEADTTSAGFDSLARPLKTRQFSSLSPGLERSQATEYHDSLPNWVLGQRKRLVELPSNREIERHVFDPLSALVIQSYTFGRLTNSFRYCTNSSLCTVGTLDTLYDAINRPTVFQDFKRGQPQRAVFADGTVASRVVDNLGNVTSITNEAGTTTSYTYDAMGRVASINYPGGPQEGYAPTFQSFTQSASEAFGLAAGHWRQTVQTGNGYRHRYFDALWRPRLEHSYDALNMGATQRFVETRYSGDGGKSFESYPSRSMNWVDQAMAGKSTVYDGLDRVIFQRADSELGPLDTTTEYLSGFQRKVTNPRGFATTYSFQAFDAPSEDVISSIGMADGSWLSIARDVYGKPLSIARGGTYAGATQQATRSYVYDVFQRLCKTIEPETGATLQSYDPAGNLAWRASGLNLPDVGNCEYSSVPASRRVAFTYDARDRLLNTTYGDGSPGITRTYTADGLLNTIVSGGSSWGYSYNNRRLLSAEALLASPFSSAALSVGHVYDIYGKARYLVYPDGTTIDYGNNALGQPTQVGAYASGVAYHPNGVVSNYTLGNGRAHSTTLNVRGLPSHRRDDAMLWDVYTYDANGNVTGISDWQEGISSRTMAYDALDRLTVANGVWGSGTFGYDALDNLRTSVVGARGLTHQYADGTNRLTGLTGSQNVSFGYDANGNITQRGSQGFLFDIGNRIQQATGKASYSYDGHGRRYWVQNWDGSWKLQFYSQSGKLLMSWSSGQGLTKHVYLGDKLLAEVNGSSGVSYFHTDALGSPVAKSSTGGGLFYRTRYEPYGATAAGTNPVGIGFTGHVNDGDTGLVYMQQRYYDPLAGRFLSVDPVVTDAQTGGFFNRYVYALSNPFKFTDPTGMAPADCSNTGASMCKSTGSLSGGADAAASVAAANARAAVGSGSSAVSGSGGAAISGSGLRAAAAGAGRLLGPLSLALTPSSLGDGTLYGAAGLYAAREGMIVYRVWGGLAGPFGRSWTPVNPDVIGVGLYRDMAGLPKVNDGSRLSTGILLNRAGVQLLPAEQLDGNRGGLPEYRVPNPALQIRILSTQERNPPF